MSNDVDMKERESYVIFHPTRGFVKNKNKDFTDDFGCARVFGKKAHADSSVKMSGKELAGAVVIPVRMELDPRKLFTAVLMGA